MTEQNPGAPKASKAGLEGIVAATTGISNVDGEAGRLIYRGYDIHDLAHAASYEEIAHLLWFGHLPTAAELSKLEGWLSRERHLEPELLAVLSALPMETAPMDALRTLVSAWGLY